MMWKWSDNMDYLLVSLIVLSAVVIMILNQFVKDFDSGADGGLDRTVTVYDNSENQIAVYEGKIDIEYSKDGNKVEFDLDGKHVILYNCSVIVEEK